MKKIFIKLAKALGYEIIDQNNFISPTLNKELNEDLSSINNQSIVLPLGEVKITKKINSLLIIFRTNTSVEIWDQNKKRLFEKPKLEYSLRSLNSLIKSIKYLKEKLKIDFNEVTKDGKFCLKESECMGACGGAPLLTVNNQKMHEHLNIDKVDQLLKELK